VKMHRLSLGVCGSIYALTPEIEFFWLREYQPRNHEWGSDYPKTINYVGGALRLGLGAWIDFGSSLNGKSARRLTQ
jgi:hypothetical protein